MRVFVRRVRRRLRLAWLADTAQTAAPIAAAGVAVVALLDWLTGRPVVDVRVIGVILVALAMSLLVRAATVRITEWDAARSAERRLGLKDVLTTSLEFTDGTDPLHRQIQTQAEHAVAVGRPSLAVPIPAHPDRLGKAALLAVAALVLSLLPTPGSSAGASTGAEGVLAEEAAAVEQLADAVEKAALEDSGEIGEELRELAEEIRNSESLEEALRALDRTEKQLEAGLDPRFLSQKAAIQGLSRELALRPLAEGAPLDAASQIEALADQLEDLSPEELAALADRLEDLAAAQEAGNAGLANDLNTAASALSTGSPGGAADALRSAAANQRTGLGDARQTQAINETLAALDRVGARLGTAANPTQTAAGNENQSAGDGSGDGEGTGQGEGAGQGAGAGQGSGQGGQPGGGAGEISGVRGGTGDAGGQGGQGTVGSGSGDLEEARDVATSSVFDPIMEGSTTDQLQVGIDGGTGDGAIIGRGDVPTEAGQALVPYTQALPTYLADAADALAQLQLPPSLRDIVRNYFDRLAEEAR